MFEATPVAATTNPAPAVPSQPTVTPTPPAAAVVPVAHAVTTDAVKAARYEATNAALEAHQKEVEATVAKEAIAAKAAEDAKAADVVTTQTLSAQLAELKAQQAATSATLAEKSKAADKLDAVAALIKSGRHYDAILAMKDIGLNFDEAVQDVMNPTRQKPAAAAAEPDDDAAKQPDPEILKLQEQVKQMQQRIADADAKEAAAAKEEGRKSVVAHVTANAKDFPFLASKEDWVNQALQEAEPEYVKAVEANKGEDISQEAKNGIIIKALTDAEAKHKANAAAYAAVGQPKPPTSVTKVVTPVLSINPPRAGLTPAVTTGKLTIEQLKAARRN